MMGPFAAQIQQALQGLGLLPAGYANTEVPTWSTSEGRFIPGSGGAGGGGILHQVVVSLTNAQVKALPTTAVQILPAQGANLLIIPQQYAMIANLAAGYTALDADGWIEVIYAPGVGPTMVVANDSGTGLGDLTNLLGTARIFSMLGGLAYYPNASWGLTPLQMIPTDSANQALQIRADNGGTGNYTGGNAANTLKVSVTYLILNISTGVFA